MTPMMKLLLCFSTLNNQLLNFQAFIESGIYCSFSLDTTMMVFMAKGLLHKYEYPYMLSLSVRICQLTWSLRSYRKAQMKWLFCVRSRLMVVRREAKVIAKKTKHAMNYCVCLLHEQTFSSFDVIITVTISRAASTLRPALKTQNLLANINQHPKDKSNRLSSLSFPAWSKLMNFVFTFFFLWWK